MPTYSIEPACIQGLEQPVVISPDQPIDVSVRVFSRRKASDPQQQPIKGRPPMHINRNTIDTLFGQPQAQAAQHLNISVTALKQICRKLGVTRWPCGRGKTRHNAQRATLTVDDSSVSELFYLQPKPQLGGPEVALPQPVAGTIANASGLFENTSLHWDGWNSWMEFIESSCDWQMPTPQPVTSTVKFNSGVVREQDWEPATTPGTYLHWDG